MTPDVEGPAPPPQSTMGQSPDTPPAPSVAEAQTQRQPDDEARRHRSSPASTQTRGRLGQRARLPADSGSTAVVPAGAPRRPR